MTLPTNPAPVSDQWVSLWCPRLCCHRLTLSLPYPLQPPHSTQKLLAHRPEPILRPYLHPQQHPQHRRCSLTLLSFLIPLLASPHSPSSVSPANSHRVCCHRLHLHHSCHHVR